MKKFNLILAALLCAAAAAHADEQGAFGDAVIVEKPFPVVEPKPPVQFNVKREDGNFRKVISRWADDAGWAFQDQYWAVDHDVPTIGSGELGTDFKTAVRALLRSTELTDFPIKPCFYTNHVVRVIVRNEKCDRTKE